MYITSTEYNTYTDRPAIEATPLRIKISSKLLDSRIGNYPIGSNGYKITENFQVYCNCNCNSILTTLHQSKIDAVKMWVSTMVSYLYDNNNNPPSGQADNIKLGRFNISGTAPNIPNNYLSSEMQYVDSILISSGLIKRSVII
jgi:hypothetical protein